MAYNAISGSVVDTKGIRPRPPSNGFERVDWIISGSFVGDGAAIDNIPRVSNCGNNRVLTSVGMNGNNLTAEPYMLFDAGPSAGVLEIVGDISASMGISSSQFQGDGRLLTNLSAMGPNYSLQFRGADGLLTASADVQYNSSVFSLNGGLKLSRRSVTSHTTASMADYYIGVNTNTPSAIIDVRLPLANTLNDGQTFVIKDEGGAANSYRIVVKTSGSDTIDGATETSLLSPFSAISVYCDGASKFFIY
jgi:hypothetical protein